METVGMAIASYERTLNAAASPFDHWYYGGEKDALAEQARRGFRLFEGKAGCSACHRVGPEYALFTDDLLHNTGVGYAASMGVGLPRPEVVLGPGLRLELDAETLRSISEPPPSDLGLYELTQDPADRWKYKTPSLRNVALTSPYMHNGAFATLREVVEFYDRGGVPNELLDPLIHPLGLSDEEVDALVAFLESLTGTNVGSLVADALAAPVGDLTRSDPNWAHGSSAHGLGE
jgi:cytochrome c peroxidase